MTEPRTAEEVLDLLEQAMNKRRAYVKRKIDRIPKDVRKQGPRDHKITCSQMFNGGELNAITLFRCFLQGLKDGSLHPDDIYNEKDDVI